MWIRLLVIILLGVAYGKQAKNTSPKSHINVSQLHQPSKRGTIVTKNNNEYTGTKPIRRQEVIHVLNEKNVENDDDIESYGKVIDSNNEEVTNKDSNTKAKSYVPEGKTNSVSHTRELIAKIKEIQDKLFKRTNAKELADELAQMSPDSSSPLNKKKDLDDRSNESVANNKLDQDFFQSEIKSLDEVIKNISAKRQLKQYETKKTIKDNSSSPITSIGDGSKGPVRRKIIPEEVVDKILEKFQQLRSEAKHMALLEAQNKNLNEDKISAQTQETQASNPYASIGPAKENLELKNRTGGAVKSIGINLKQDSLPLSFANPSSISLNNQVGSVQIPIENSASEAAKDLGSVKEIPGVPLMFIKNGEALVPVYGSNSHPKISYTDTGMAELKANPSVGLPSLPVNIVPLASPQQQSSVFTELNPMDQFLTTQSVQQSILKQPYINNFMPAHLNQAPPSLRCEIAGISCPTPTIAQLFQQASSLREQLQQEQIENMHQLSKNYMTLPSPQQLQQEQYIRQYNQRQQKIQQLQLLKQEQERLQAQQQQLASGLSNFEQNNFENNNRNMHIPENMEMTHNNFPHFIKDKLPQLQLQQEHQEEAGNYPINNLFGSNSPSMQTEPSTISLINDILKTPDIPRLTTQIMDENSPYHDRANQNDQTNTRGFNDFTNNFANSNSGAIQSMRAGDIQFDLKQNLAKSNYPGESSMIENTQNFMHEPSGVSQIQSYPTNPVLPLRRNPFTEHDDVEDQDNFHDKNAVLNNISDPPTEQSEEEESRFRNQNPDELLNYANMRSMERSFHPDNRPTASIDSLNRDENRISNIQQGSERALMRMGNTVDPSTLLDKIQGTELKGGLLGAGDPNWFSPTFKNNEDKESILDSSPDDLLESLRKQNDKIFEKNGQDMALEFRKSHLQTEFGRSRADIPDGIDPSFADEIQPIPARFDVRSKERYLQSHPSLYKSNLFRNVQSKINNQPTQFSVLSGDMVQYKHGRMSVDSSNVINSFLSESPQYRNKILRPTPSSVKNDSLKYFVRNTIAKTLTDDSIKHRFDKSLLNDTVLVQKNENYEKKTISHRSKTFIPSDQSSQLLHGTDKKKIVNIKTKSKYNVTEKIKRNKISKVKLPV